MLKKKLPIMVTIMMMTFIPLANAGLFDIFNKTVDIPIIKPNITDVNTFLNKIVVAVDKTPSNFTSVGFTFWVEEGTWCQTPNFTKSIFNQNWTCYVSCNATVEKSRLYCNAEFPYLTNPEDISPIVNYKNLETVQQQKVSSITGLTAQASGFKILSVVMLLGLAVYHLKSKWNGHVFFGV